MPPLTPNSHPSLPTLTHTHTHANIMGEATNILRTSVHTFLQRYTSLVSVAVLLGLPFSSSLLLSQSLPSLSPSFLRLISSRLHSLFLAAKFPPSSLLNLILSQSLFSSTLTLPFTLTFLLFAKSWIAQVIIRRKNSNLYLPLLKTHIFNSFIFLSTNASIFILFLIIVIAGDLTGLLSKTSLVAMFMVGAILYTTVVANIVVISNMAVIVSATESWRGYVHAVITACALLKGKVATALSIAVTMNVAMTLVESLFQYRVMRRYNLWKRFDAPMVCEGFMIAYMHSLLVVLEIVVSCVFYKKCRLSRLENLEGGFGYGDYGVEFEPEDKCQV